MAVILVMRRPNPTPYCDLYDPFALQVSVVQIRPEMTPRWEVKVQDRVQGGAGRRVPAILAVPFWQTPR